MADVVKVEFYALYSKQEFGLLVCVGYCMSQLPP